MRPSKRNNAENISDDENNTTTRPYGAERFVAKGGKNPGAAYWAIKRPNGGFKYFKWEDDEINRREKENYLSTYKQREPSPPTTHVVDLDRMKKSLPNHTVTTTKITTTLPKKYRGRPVTKVHDRWAGDSCVKIPAFNVHDIDTSTNSEDRPMSTAEFDKIMAYHMTDLKDYMLNALEVLHDNMVEELNDMRELIREGPPTPDTEYKPPKPTKTPKNTPKPQKRKREDSCSTTEEVIAEELLELKK